jgi:hypothetical protein
LWARNKRAPLPIYWSYEESREAEKKMVKENPINKEAGIPPKEKMKIPPDVQKKMMDFFMRTSIPRKKALSENSENNHLSTKETDR